MFSTFISFSAVLGLVNYVAASCSQSCTLDTVVLAKELTWCPCYNGFFCAKLEVCHGDVLVNMDSAVDIFQVPLDYNGIELGRAAVPLVKYAARQNSSFGDYQGMILLNPGGPGVSGTSQALEYGPTIQVSYSLKLRGPYLGEQKPLSDVLTWVTNLNAVSRLQSDPTSTSSDSILGAYTTVSP